MASIEELEQAFVKADAAGNFEDAQVFATAIKDFRTSNTEEPSFQDKMRTKIGKAVSGEELQGGVLSTSPSQQQFQQNMGRALEERVTGLGETISNLASFEESPKRAEINILGDVAGLGLDVAGAATTKVFSDIASITPQPIKNYTKDVFKGGVSYIANSPVGRFGIDAAKKGVEAYSDWKDENPKEAKTLESFVNIGLLLAPVSESKGRGVLEGLSKASKKSGLKSLRVSNRKDAMSYIMPEGIDLPVAQRREVGGFGRKRVEAIPTTRQEMILDEVSKLNIPSGSSKQKAYQDINEAITDKATKLSSELNSSQVSIPTPIVEKSILDASNAVRDLKVELKQPNLSTLVDEVSEKALEMVRNNPQTPAGILQARKDLDGWLNNSRISSNTIFPTEGENATSTAVRAVRDSLNNLVHDAVPDAKVKAKLEQQMLLFNARDAVEDKARLELQTSLGRVMAGITKSTGIHSPSTPLAIVATAGAAATYLAGAAVPATMLAGGIGTIYLGKKFIMSPSTRLGLAKAVSGLDKLINVTANKEALKTMRADRAVVIQLIENSQISEDVDDNQQGQ